MMRLWLWVCNRLVRLSTWAVSAHEWVSVGPLYRAMLWGGCVYAGRRVPEMCGYALLWLAVGRALPDGCARCSGAASAAALVGEGADETAGARVYG